MCVVMIETQGNLKSCPFTTTFFLIKSFSSNFIGSLLRITGMSQRILAKQKQVHVWRNEHAQFPSSAPRCEQHGCKAGFLFYDGETVNLIFCKISNISKWLAPQMLAISTVPAQNQPLINSHLSPGCFSQYYIRTSV